MATIARQENGMTRLPLFYPHLVLLRAMRVRNRPLLEGVAANSQMTWLCRGLVCVVLLWTPVSACASDLSIADIDRMITAGELDKAATAAKKIDADGAASVDTTLVMARLARSFAQAGQNGRAAEFYMRSIDATARPAAAALAVEKVRLVRLAATSALLQTGQIEKALEVVTPTVAEKAELSESHRRMTTQLCLRIGSAAFAAKDHSSALKAYNLVEEIGRGDQKTIASLGAAWATALTGQQPVEAARRLAAFVEAHPDHSDAARATRACAECLKQAGRHDDANNVLGDLLSRWPTSAAAMEVVRNQPSGQLDLEEIAPAVRQWMLGPAALEQMSSLPVNIVQAGISVAAIDGQHDFFEAYCHQLASADKSGQTTSDVLQWLASTQHAAEAERLATLLIAPPAVRSGAIQPRAREAACRWAGRTQRWSMLALASETETLDPKQPPPASRTAATERLFAEALVQTQRARESQRWWNYLVDQRGAEDFATLLRCAEVETSAGNEVETAKRRIAAARTAAGENVFQRSLVSLLEAELAIRSIQFDQARAHLESVIRATETDHALRGRAQWLIGETFYLQQEFADAIEAYRRVEGIDSNGPFVAVSLLQAGKSFEQLGRTREAAVCYWGLLSRFAGSQYAALARRRLAKIAPQQLPSEQDNDPILRR